MKTPNVNPNTYVMSVFLAYALLLISCGGCRSGKVINTEKNTLSNTSASQVDTQKSVISDNNDGVGFKQLEIHLERNYLGKDINLILNPNHEGGEAWNAIWEEKIDNPTFDRMNRIVQLSPTVLLYRRFPKEVSKDFYYVDQPDKIEFLDTTYKSIKIVDIWNNRPYQDIKNTKLTYWNFDSEGMGVIPYAEQKDPIKPNEYSLFTHIHSEGNHVVLNYELRSIKNIKNFGIDGYSSNVVAVKHTLHVYDLFGNLKYILNDLPSVDQAVVSNDGKYMMYVFGGMGLANANSPFARIERSGWALMMLKDKKVVYSEYTDDGILAFNRLFKTGKLILLGYSTPKENDGVYDYFVFYDQVINVLYTKLWTHEEWSLLEREFKNSNTQDWNYYIPMFNFKKQIIK